MHYGRYVAAFVCVLMILKSGWWQWWTTIFGFGTVLLGLPAHLMANMWDRSPLFESMLIGSHNQIDFPFFIDEELFTQLFYLVDEIYPSLSQFLTLINNTFIDYFIAY